MTHAVMPYSGAAASDSLRMALISFFQLFSVVSSQLSFVVYFDLVGGRAKLVAG